MTYSQQEKKKAVDFYFSENLTVDETVKQLGYPTRMCLILWLRNDPRYGNSFRHGFYSLDKKRQAVETYLNGSVTYREVANLFGTTASTVQEWVQIVNKSGYNGLIPKVRRANMPKPILPDLPDDPDELKRRCRELILDNAILRETIVILKKDPGVDPKALTNQEKTQVIDALSKEQIPIGLLIKSIGIARSSFYYHSRAELKPQPADLVRERIISIFMESREKTYGYRRVWMSLKNEGIHISEKVVRRLMAEENLVVVKKRQRRFKSYQGEITPAPDNLVNRDFHADEPSKKLLTDITEMAASDGKVYLSPMIDCFDGMVVSYQSSLNPNAELTNSMLRKTVELLPQESKAIIHSDRGVHYRWSEWINIMEVAGLIRSMSKKACSPDNAACEGFFGRLKNEMYYQRDWKNRTTAELMAEIDSYIEWYNNSRIKMSLGEKSPVQYRQSLGLTV